MEDTLPGVGGHDRWLAMDASGRQRDDAVPLALPLVGDELVHVLGRQRLWVVPASGSVECQERSVPARCVARLLCRRRLAPLRRRGTSPYYWGGSAPISGSVCARLDSGWEV